MALAVLYVAGSLYFIFDLRGRLDKMSKDQTASSAQIADLGKRMQSAEADDETLAHQVGMTKKEMAARSADLLRQQRASEARLAEQQKEQISAVSGEVAGVKSDVGGVKTDVASTKADLEATKAKLQSTIGDLGVQSGLIANTRGDLEILKHKGDRNYYEFTLIKGAKPQPVSTVALQLKKTDPKKGKFTLNVTSDDQTIEKKDRNVSEPIQFYSGRDRMLYELGGLDRGQEKGDRIPEHAQGCADADHGDASKAHVSRRSCSGRHCAADGGDLRRRAAGHAAERQARSGTDDALRSDSPPAAQQCRAERDDRSGQLQFWAESSAASTLLLLNYLIAELSGGNRRFRKFVQGQPSLLVHDGKIIAAHMAREHVSMDELQQSLREHGIAGLPRLPWQCSKSMVPSVA